MIKLQSLNVLTVVSTLRKEEGGRGGGGGFGRKGFGREEEGIWEGIGRKGLGGDWEEDWEEGESLGGGKSD
tara:strand:- start:368 stop:580 length:213 start_codon:yes stop_codon:yes gene_type:complete